MKIDIWLILKFKNKISTPSLRAREQEEEKKILHFGSLKRLNFIHHITQHTRQLALDYENYCWHCEYLLFRFISQI